MLPENGRYARYKSANSLFTGWLKSVAPNVKSAKESTTNFIKEATNFVVRKSIAVPADIFAALSTSIKLRSETIMSLQKKGQSSDEGHQYYLSLLMTIGRMLKPLVRKEESSKPILSKTNRFEVLQSVQDLSLNDDDDDEIYYDENDENWYQSMNEKGQLRLDEDEDSPYAQEREVEYFRLACFQADMDDLMRQIYDVWRQFKEKKISLIAATAVTNSTIPIITHLTSTLQLDHPRIKDFDHINVILFYQEEINYLMTKFPKRISYEKAVEMIILLPYSMIERRYPETIGIYSKTCRIDEDEAEKELRSLMKTYLAKQRMRQLFSHHSFNTSRMEQTQFMLSKLAEMYDPENFMTAKNGFFGKPWNEKKNLAMGTDDLTMDFLMGKFMPLALFVFPAIHSQKIHNQNEIMPLVSLVSDFVETRKVPIPFVFAIHAMLMAVFAVQGREMTCVTVARFQQDLQEISKHPHWDSIRTRPIFESLNTWMQYFTVADAMLSVPNVTAEMKYLAMFNPWMAGQQISMISMGVAFNYGLGFLDSMGQMRMILHYYNAFRIQGIMKEPIPFMDTLIDALSKSKALWNGGRPSKSGDFLKGFLLDWGYNIKNANLYASHFSMDENPKVIHFKGPTNRKLVLPESKDILKTFRIMVKGDYSDLPSVFGSNSSNRYAILMGAIKDIVAEEADLLNLNLFFVGQKFLEIWHAICDETGLNAKAEAAIEEMKKKLTKAQKAEIERARAKNSFKESDENVKCHFQTFFLQQLLGYCDRSPENVSEKGRFQLNTAAAIIQRIAGSISGDRASRVNQDSWRE